MIATETGLWALVFTEEYGMPSVIVGADRQALEAEGYQLYWAHGGSSNASFDIVPVTIDWPSLDPQEEVICAKSAV